MSRLVFFGWQTTINRDLGRQSRAAKVRGWPDLAIRSHCQHDPKNHDRAAGCGV